METTTRAKIEAHKYYKSEDFDTVDDALDYVNMLIRDYKD